MLAITSSEHFHHLLKKSLTPVSKQSTPILIHWSLVITNLLSVCTSLFQTFHRNMIIQYVAFCDWLLSLSIVFSRFIRVHYSMYQYFFLSEVLNKIALSGCTKFVYPFHQLVDILVVCTFYLSWIVLPQTFVYKFLHRYVFSISLGW